MPRPALSKVSSAALQAELARRAAQLGKLLKIRDDVDRQIADFQGLAGQFEQAFAAAAPITEEPKVVGNRRRRRKVKAAKVVIEAGARGQYEQTATEFVLGLFSGGNRLTSAELARAWATAGRGGRIDNTLSKLVQANKLKRRKIRGGQGSRYTLVGRKQ